MRSKMTKKLIAFLLCMVLVICNSVSILADTPAPEAVSTQQVKETKAAPEVETTTKKEETTEATTEKKEKPTEAAEETTTETKEGNTKATTEVAEETTTETKEDKTEATTEVKEDNTKATTEEATTEATEETSETSEKDKKENKEATTTEGKEETVPAELTFENDDVIVTVSEVAEGAIPEGAELKVVPILKDDTETKEQYTEVEKQIQEKAAETETEIKGFLAYDITFVDEDGNEIEPNSEVKVSMEYKQAAIPEEITAEDAKDAEVSVMHLEENADGNVAKVVDMGEAGKVDTLETTDENKVEKVEVKTKSFSAYTITWTYQKRTWKLKVTCKDESTSKELSPSQTEITFNDAKETSITKLAPSIEDYVVNSGKITLYSKQKYDFTALKIEYNGEDTGTYELKYKDLQGNWRGTGYKLEKNEEVEIPVTFFYESYTKPTFYYVYVSPKEGGGYEANLLWKGNNFPDATNNPMGLQESNSEKKNELRRRYGFGDDDNNLSKEQSLKDTINDNTGTPIDNGEEYAKVEYVGARLYDKGSFERDGGYDFSAIHEGDTKIRFLKETDDGFKYSTGKNDTDSEYQYVGGKDIVFLFTDVIDRKVLSAANAEEKGLVVDFSDQLKGDTDVSVNVKKEAEWADYYNRIADISFTLSGTPKIDPLDIILVIDSSYSMDFSNYDWDYTSCSTDVSAQDFREYNRYDRFFDGDNAPNKLDGMSRMAATKYAAYSVAATFLTNNIEGGDKNNRIAVVNFSKRVNVDTGFSDNYQKVTNRIQDIETNTGTNTGEAIVEAAALAKQSKDQNRNCITIVLSDGAPTIECSAFEESKRNLKNNSTVYTIGIDLNDTTTIQEGLPGGTKTPKEFLESIATEGCAFNANGYEANGSDTNVVQQCFNAIIADLTTAAEDAIIHDIISEYFTYQGPGNSGDNVEQNNGNVNINVGKISAVDDTYTFQVKITETNQNIVGEYKTNQNNKDNMKDVYVSYNIGEIPGSTSVEEDPAVNVYREVQVRYYYLDANGNKQPINVEGTSVQDIINYIDNDIEGLNGIDAYASYKRLTDDTTTFTVTQDILNKYMESYNGVYVESSNLTESTENTYTLLDDNTKNVIDVVYYNNDMEDPLYIEVQKTFVNIKNPRVDVPNFVIELYDSEHNKLKDLRLNPGASDIAPTVSEDGLTFTWKIVGLEAGTYYVKETGEGKEGYTTTIEVYENGKWKTVTNGNGVEVTTQAPDVQFNNFNDKDNVIETCASTNPIANNTNLIAAALTGKAGYFVWTKDTLSAAERKKVVETIKTQAGHKFTNMTVGETKFFSTTEKIEDGLNFRGGVKIDHSGEGTRLKFNSTDQWSMVCYANYTEVSGINAEIEIKNTYEENKTAIDLIKYGSNYNDTNKKEGAIFELYQGNMDEENQLQWQEEPLTNFENILVSSSDTPELSLPSGYYKLKEIEAPAGYQLLNDEIYFKVENETVKLVNAFGTEINSDSNNMWMLDTKSTIITLKIKNNVLYSLPSAGGPGIYWYTLSGALLMMGAALIVYKQQRKREVLLKK